MIDYDLKQLCEDVLAHKSRSYVQDAETLAKAVLAMFERDADYRQMSENLSAVHTRCTDLLEQNRALNAELRDIYVNI